MNEIIFAPATAVGLAAISIIRVSGKGCKKILRDMINGNIPKERVISLRSFYNPKKMTLIDKCIVCWVPKNSSFTGEDSFEIHCHGGTAVMNSFFDALLTFKNVRLAEQGEFSKRSIINGKMNLIDAEAVNDLINAETEQQMFLALKQINKSLAIPIKKWRKLLIKSMSHIEANIDFSDEEDVAEKNIYNKYLLKLEKEMQQMLINSREYKYIKEGISIVLTGKPNAGKSSLFNSIIKSNKSIVTDVPGTTRDVIESKININGYPVTFVDTAGIDKTNNKIEKEGIKRAKEQIKKANIVLNIIDSSNYSDVEINQKHWNVFNKVDKIYKNKEDFIKPKTFFRVSAKSGKGIENLIKAISEHITSRTENIRNANYFYSSFRQRKELEDTSEYLKHAIIEKDDEIKAEYLRLANKSLGRMLGQADIEEVLGEIFSSFCIGK